MAQDVVRELVPQHRSEQRIGIVYPCKFGADHHPVPVGHGAAAFADLEPAAAGGFAGDGQRDRFVRAPNGDG